MFKTFMNVHKRKSVIILTTSSLGITEVNLVRYSKKCDFLYETSTNSFLMSITVFVLDKYQNLHLKNLSIFQAFHVPFALNL